MATWASSYNKLVLSLTSLYLLNTDEEALMRSKELLDTLNDDSKLILIHQNAEDVVLRKARRSY
jgi:hypothetical protein